MGLIFRSPRNTREKELLRAVLNSPVNHRGARTKTIDGVQTVEKYTAKRIPDTLLNEIRKVVHGG